MGIKANKIRTDWLKQRRGEAKKNRRKTKRTVPEIIRAQKKIKSVSYPTFLKSDYWKLVRLEVLKRDEYKCIICGSHQNIEVHHSTYKNHRNEHNHLGDLDTLCRIHHQEIHTIKDIV